MMISNQLQSIMTSIFFLSALFSCNYLDIMPDEIATDDDAFATIQAAENCMYSCYAYIPNPRNGTGSLDWFTGDEIVTAFEHETFASCAKGNYTAVSPVICWWNTLVQGDTQWYRWN